MLPCSLPVAERDRLGRDAPTVLMATLATLATGLARRLVYRWATHLTTRNGWRTHTPATQPKGQAESCFCPICRTCAEWSRCQPPLRAAGWLELLQQRLRFGEVAGSRQQPHRTGGNRTSRDGSSPGWDD